MGNEQVISGVAQRYAGSLFGLASESKAADTIAQELAQLSKGLEDSIAFKNFVMSPTLTSAEQISGLKGLFNTFGLKGLTANFVMVLAQNRRLGLLSQIVVAYQRLLKAQQNIVSAEVISAEPLSENQAQALKSALGDATGKTVELEPHVDQSLIGGLIVKLGSRMLDTSLKTKLSQLKITLKEAS